jgi:hypothetical protein
VPSGHLGWQAAPAILMHVTQMEKLGKTVWRFGARHGKHMQYTAAKVYFLSSMIAVLLLASIFLRGAYLILDGGMQVTKSLWTLRPMSNIFQPKRQPAFDPVVDFQSF